MENREFDERSMADVAMTIETCRAPPRRTRKGLWRRLCAFAWYTSANRKSTKALERFEAGGQ